MLQRHRDTLTAEKAGSLKEKHIIEQHFLGSASYDSDHVHMNMSQCKSPLAAGC